MPSLLRKLSRRCRQGSTTSNAAGQKKKGDHGHCQQPQEPKIMTSLLPGDLPLSIQVDSAPSSLMVSPLKSSPPSQHSPPSLALTESTLSSHPSWNDSTSGSDAQDGMSSSDDSTDACLTATGNTNLGVMVIPPRPAQSRWNQDDFLKVVRVWNLSQEEVVKMRDLEAQLYNVNHWKNNPFEVVRFMKGPQGYKPAERLFRRMIDWRLANSVDTILDDYTPPRVLLDYCPSAILHGLDKDGDPIYLERAGATDAYGLLRRFGHDALMHHVVWLRELCGRGPWIQDHEERMGGPITQVTIVYDLAGLNARHLRSGVLPFFGHMMRLTQDYYTGPVKRMIIIRAPAIFRAVWGIVKHFFDPWAVQKMTFSGAHNYEEVLSQFMDLSVLPPVVSFTYGRGRAAEGMPQRFEGGIPPLLDDDDDKNNLSTPIKSTTHYDSHHHANSNSTPTTTTTQDEEQNNNSGVVVSTSLLGSGFFHLDDTSRKVFVEPVEA